MKALDAICGWLADHGFVGVALMIGFCLGAMLTLNAYMRRQTIREPDEHEKGLLQ